MRSPAILSSIPGLLSPRRQSRSRILELQSRLLGRLLDWTGPRVPELEARLRSAAVGGLSGVEALERLEPVTRNDLQGLPTVDRLAAGVQQSTLVSRRTGGSTGRPLEVNRTPVEEHFINLFRRRAYHLLGLRSADRSVSVLAVEMSEGRRLLLGGLRQFLRWYGDERIPCGQPAAALEERLEEIQADVIGTYPSVAAHLAARHRDNWSPRLAFLAGEAVLPHVRDLVEKSWGCPVRNLYAMTECNLVAWECPETGLMHLNDDAVVVEVLKAGRPVEVGEEGEVVITSLHSYAMPFVRYRTGDVAVRGPASCPCGLPFGTLSEVRGRVTDYITLADGRELHPTQLIARLLGAADGCVRQFQFVQESTSRVDLALATAQPLEPATAVAIRTALEDLLGSGVDLQIEVEAHTAVRRLGKRRVCISRVRSLYDEYDPLLSDQIREGREGPGFG